jgi:hypothetical protein
MRQRCRRFAYVLSSPAFCSFPWSPRRRTASASRLERRGRYIFGRIDRTTYSAQVRFNLTFKPDLNLDLYAEPFAASGRYENFGELAAARGRLLLPIEPSTPGISVRDFNVLSFRSNVVLRWEWRVGSTLYFVWQQDRAQDEAGRSLATAGDLFRAFAAPGDQSIAVKASYWFSPR